MYAAHKPPGRPAAEPPGRQSRQSLPRSISADGALTGLNKKETVAKYGEDQVKLWRRSYSTPPPEIELDSPHWPGNSNEYAHIEEDDLPRSECLKDCVERTLPYWESDIVPALMRGKCNDATGELGPSSHRRDSLLISRVRSAAEKACWLPRTATRSAGS